MQYRMQAHYRRDVTRQYLRLPMSWHQQHPTGQLLSNANSDVEAAWAPIAPLPMAVGTVAMMVIAVAQMLFTDVVLAVVGLLVFPVVIAANVVYQRCQSPLMTRAQALRAELSEVAHESFDGALVVKSLGRETEETERFARKARPAARRQRPRRPDPRRVRPGPRGAPEPRRAGRPRRRRGPRRAGRSPTPATSSPSPTCSRSCPSRSARSAGWSGSSRAAWSASTGCRRCSTPPARWRTATASSPPPRPVPVSTYAHLGYRYDRRPAAAARTSASPSRPGRTVAVVGATASGKSTLTSLLLRLVDPGEGEVLLDGLDLRDLAAGAAGRARRRWCRSRRSCSTTPCAAT